ncbi:hypothetical protein Bca4012_021019 [Brassica carinata]
MKTFFSELIGACCAVKCIVSLVSLPASSGDPPTSSSMVVAHRGSPVVVSLARFRISWWHRVDVQWCLSFGRR